MTPHLVHVENLVRMGMSLDSEQLAVLRQNYGRIDSCSDGNGGMVVNEADPRPGDNCTPKLRRGIQVY